MRFRFICGAIAFSIFSTSCLSSAAASIYIEELDFVRCTPKAAATQGCTLASSGPVALGGYDDAHYAHYPLLTTAGTLGARHGSGVALPMEDSTDSTGNIEGPDDADEAAAFKVQAAAYKNEYKVDATAAKKKAALEAAAKKKAALEAAAKKKAADEFSTASRRRAEVRLERKRRKGETAAKKKAWKKIRKRYNKIAAKEMAVYEAAAKKKAADEAAILGKKIIELRAKRKIHRKVYETNCINDLKRSILNGDKFDTACWAKIETQWEEYKAYFYPEVDLAAADAAYEGAEIKAPIRKKDAAMKKIIADKEANVISGYEGGDEASILGKKIIELRAKRKIHRKVYETNCINDLKRSILNGDKFDTACWAKIETQWEEYKAYFYPEVDLAAADAAYEGAEIKAPIRKKDAAMKEAAAKKKAADEATEENAALIAKKKADEAAKKKAAEEKAAEKQAAIDDAFSVFDMTAIEAAAKIKAAKEKAAAQETKEDSSYILTSESLMEMVGPLLKKYPQLADIKNIKIKKLTDVTQYKTITKDGIVKTIRCNPCSYHSATLQGLRTGMDLGMPKDIFDAIYNAINDEFGGERPINKSDMRKLIISIWKNLENVMAKAMADPNFNIANTMTKEQIQQIKSQQRKTHAGSKDNSGGSTAGGVTEGGATEGHQYDAEYEEDHHEEESYEEADEGGDDY